MKTAIAPNGTATPPQRRVRGSIRIVVLLVLCFGLGVAVSGFWFLRANRSSTQPTEGTQGETAQISDTTRDVLGGLNAPVEIRFYSVLDPATTPEAVSAFSARVAQLLAEYQKQSNGKVKITRYDSSTYEAAKAAQADGVKAFNQDKGEACYLGLAVIQNGQKQSLGDLSPAWGAALESDLTRAIARVATVPAAAAAAAVPADSATIEQVRRALPNADAVSLEDGTRALREAALQEFRDSTKLMQAQVAEAQQRVIEAQSGGSDAAQKAALDSLHQLQAEQTQKLKEIAAGLQARLAALQQIKTASAAR